MASDAQEETRRDALTAFLEERLDEGYLVETRTDTHAIIAKGAAEPTSLLRRLRRHAPRDRQVVEVDESGNVTTSPAEPLRS